MTKPHVQYKNVKGTFIRVGLSAMVFPLNHKSSYASNTCLVNTSLVLSYDKVTGNFETQNTFYELVGE